MLTVDDVVRAVERHGRRRVSGLLAEHAGRPGLNAAFFQRVVQLMGESPNRARDLASHWPTFARYGDDPGLAHRTKGVGERLEGKWRQSARSFLRASELAPSRLDALAYSVGAIDSLARAGDLRAALRHAERLIRGFQDHGRPDLAARASLNAGNALLLQDRFADALPWFRQAVSALAEHGSPADHAGALLSLSTCELFGGSPLSAREHLRQAMELFDALDQPHFTRLARLNLAQDMIMRGQADEAIPLLRELRTAFAADSPDDLPRIEEALGDACLRLNLLEESIAAYRSAIAGRPSTATRAQAEFGIGSAHRLAGRPEEARSWFESARARFRALGNRSMEEACWIERARCERALGDPVAAARAALRGAPQRRTTSQWNVAEAELEAAAAALTTGASPDRALARAERVVERQGFASLAWQVAHLRALSRRGPARRRHWRTMIIRLEEGRLLSRSTASRARFMRDKDEALRTYLGELLESGRPGDVQEALTVVAQTRGVSLADEIRAARSGSSRAEWGEIRERANLLHANARLGQRLTDEWEQVRREFLEATHGTSLASSDQFPPVDPDVLVWVDTGEHLHSLRQGTVRTAPLAASSINEAASWLRFDLLEAMLDRRADPGHVLRRADDLALALGLDGQTVIAPESTLWTLPWPLLCDEPALLLHPGFAPAADGGRLPPQPRVLVWAAASPDLPGVEREVEIVCSQFPGATVVRTAADVRSHLAAGDWDLVHVCGHGHHEPDNPMFSRLEYADGSVYAAEIATGGLSARFVVLSACDTGVLSTATRTEPDGMVRAFLARGAETVVASTWPLDDEAAVITMNSLYDRLAQGSSLADGLRQARVDCRKQLAHPYFWASLVRFGGYRL